LTREIDRAVDLLRAGGLVAFPTETVYGLGANASDPSAVRRIFAAKGRPADHPLIVHLGSHQQIEHWAREIPPAAYTLGQHFWPGPLTLILKRATHVLDEVTGGQDSVGLRIPSHPVAQALLRTFEGGIAGPSANRFGRISPTTAAHVRAEMGDRVDLILEGGACEVGIESTIVDLTGSQPVLLRPGHISVPRIESLLGIPVGAPGTDSPRASGTLAAHYAPSKPLYLASSGELRSIVERELMRGKVGVLAFQDDPVLPRVIWRQTPLSNDAYAHLLYAALRELDASDAHSIVVETPPAMPEWLGVRDRLMRSAVGSVRE